MKNITVFAVLVSILLLFFSGTAAWAFSYTFSFTPRFGFLYGKGTENLYKYPDRDDLVSELLWDLKPLFYVGTSIDFVQKDPFVHWGFFTDLSFKYGLSWKTGSMEDRDWQAVNNEDLTNYSKHTASAEKALILDYNIGFSIPIASRVIIRAYTGLSYMSFSWEGRDGYLQYAKAGSPWTPDIPKEDIVGLGINYLQEWLIIYPGVSAKVKISRLFSADLFFNASPIIYCAAQDDHFMKEVQYNDYIRGGLFIEGGGSFTFSPHARVDLTLHTKYRHIKGTRGPSYFKNTGNTTDSFLYKSSYDGGAGFGALDTGLSVKLRF
jgi:outer membrane protease